MTLGAFTGGGSGNAKSIPWILNAVAGSNLSGSVIDKRHVQLDCVQAMRFTEQSLATTGDLQLAGFSVLEDGVELPIVVVEGNGLNIIDIYLYNNISASTTITLNYRSSTGDALDNDAETIAVEQVVDETFDDGFNADADLGWKDVFAGSTMSAGQLSAPAGQIVSHNLYGLSTSNSYTVTIDIASCTGDFIVDYGVGNIAIESATYGSGGVFTTSFNMPSATEAINVNTFSDSNACVINGFSVVENVPDSSAIRPSINNLSVTNNAGNTVDGLAISSFSSSQVKCLIDGSLLNGSNKLYDSSPSGTAVLANTPDADPVNNGILFLDSTLNRYSNQPVAGFWNYATDALRDAGNEVHEALDSGAWKSLLDSANNAFLVLTVGRYTDPDGSTEAYDGKMTLRTSGTANRIAQSANGVYHGLLNSDDNSLNTTGGAQPTTILGVDFAMTMKYHNAGVAANAIFENHYQRLDGTYTGGEPTKLLSADLGTDFTPEAGIIFEGFTLYGYLIFEFQGGFPSTINDDIQWIVRKFAQGDLVMPDSWVDL